MQHLLHRLTKMQRRIRRQLKIQHPGSRQLKMQCRMCRQTKMQGQILMKTSLFLPQIIPRRTAKLHKDTHIRQERRGVLECDELN